VTTNVRADVDDKSMIRHDVGRGVRMEMLLVWFALTSIFGALSFVVGRKFGVKNVCHSGKVSYGVTWDGRVAVNIILVIDDQPFRFAVRVPRRASEQIAKAVIDKEDVEIEGGTIGGSATPLH
jgi:hypothetical protein